GARATFFLLVEQAQANDALVARIVADGHEVGLHGLDHRRLTRMAVADLAGHIRAGRHALEAVVGRPLRWFRPPFGSQSFASWRAALAVGLTPVVWSIDVQDWIDQPPEVLVSRARRDAACGGILLLHDLLASDPDDPTTEASTGFDRAATIGAVVSGLRSDGWDLTSVGDLLRGRRVWRSVWFRRV
ncbi:MAG TPA: polysaccharide deacetylase family protein, partial [Acidimicrobiales bacterium]|nr:polysaccharide deacetylase family protein [Acidimicrobiales bacterium]